MSWTNNIDELTEKAIARERRERKDIEAAGYWTLLAWVCGFVCGAVSVATPFILRALFR